MSRLLVAAMMSAAARLVPGRAAEPGPFQPTDHFSITEISQPQVSPEARRIIFQQRRGNLERNRYEPLIVPVFGRGAPARLFPAGPVTSSGHPIPVELRSSDPSTSTASRSRGCDRTACDATSRGSSDGCFKLLPGTGPIDHSTVQSLRF